MRASGGPSEYGDIALQPLRVPPAGASGGRRHCQRNVTSAVPDPTSSMAQSTVPFTFTSS